MTAPFADFAAAADDVGATRSKLAKRDRLAAYLRDLEPAELRLAATWFAGRPLPGVGDRLGLGWVQQAAALSAAAGVGGEALNESYLRHSDGGDVAAELLSRRERRGAALTVDDVGSGTMSG